MILTSNTTLRAAGADDAAPLAGLKLAAFRETFIEGFAIPYPPYDRARFEQTSYSLATVAAELGDPEKATWVVEADGALLGYAHVGPCKLPHPEVGAWAGELYQLYLLKSAQGLGLGKQLMDIAFAHLAATRPGPIWLGVWSGNLKAQAFYAALGFAKVGEYQFPVGAWRDDEFIYRRP